MVTDLLLLLAQTVQNFNLNPPGSSLSPFAAGAVLFAGATLFICTCAIVYDFLMQDVSVTIGIKKRHETRV